MMAFCFPKTARLRERRDFLFVQRRGCKVHDRHLIVIAWQRRDDGETRLGITASKKVGNAVERNRVKRLLREAFRLQRQQFPPALDCVVIARHSLLRRTFEQIQSDLYENVQRAHRQLQQRLEKRRLNASPKPQKATENKAETDR